jgi:hypothetical protein
MPCSPQKSATSVAEMLLVEQAAAEHVADKEGVGAFDVGIGQRVEIAW